MKVNVLPRSARTFAASAMAAGLLVAGAPAAAQAASLADPPNYILASVQTGGGKPLSCAGALCGVHFFDPSVSDDGRFTVFSSNADDLVPGDTNHSMDVFLRDSVEDVTTRISVSSAGQEGSGDSSWSNRPSMSADGRYIAFMSGAEGLVLEDTNNAADAFLRDAVSGVTTRVSLTGDGAQIPQGVQQATLSSDGRFVVFETVGRLVASDTDDEADVYLRELATGRTVRVSESFDGQPLRRPASRPREFKSLAVTSGGRHVVFSSEVENLVPGDTNSGEDVFVRDVAAGTTVRASVTDSGEEIAGYSDLPSMSANGRYVAFLGRRDNIVPGVKGQEIYVRDLVEKTTTLASVRGIEAMRGAYVGVNISPDGRYLAFSAVVKNSNQFDIYVRDLRDRITRVASVSYHGGALTGNSSSAKFSANSRHLAFMSKARYLLEGDGSGGEKVYVRLNVG